MGTSHFIKARVSLDVKARVRAITEQQFITESVLLKQLVFAALREPVTNSGKGNSTPQSSEASPHLAVLRRPEGAPAKRLYVRLSPDDGRLLRERAEARQMPAATYVSVLVRAHLHNLTPLPKDELLALKRAVAQLGALGRNINQLAKAMNEGRRIVTSDGRVPVPTTEHLETMLEMCEALHAHVKVLIKANINSWRIGYGEDEN